MKQFLVAALLFIAIAACDRKKETASSEALQVYQQSMKIHDEIMPRMDEMYKLEGQLKSLRDSLLTDSAANTTRIALVNEKLLTLQTAAKDMMDWMHDVQSVPGSKTSAHEHHTDSHEAANASSSEEILETQKQQKEKIESVKETMLISIEQAKEVIKGK